ncbi:hypothetical protein [Streptomyces sp. NPDC060194]|uniref:Rv1733c family protein n=1 Tax=Streptomyces sp. NPDC060194 TaxID=3347069 RepID=UPI00365722E5
MRALSGIWRWRHNPLRRTTDLVEAWVALGALLLIVLAAPVAGGFCGALADDALQQSVQRQQRERHLATASVVRPAAWDPADPDPESTTVRGGASRVVAVWSGPDGVRHTGTTSAAPPDARPGDRFTLWTDAEGRQTTRPLDATTASTHAAIAGAGAAVVFAALVAGGRRLVVWRLDRRRYALLDRDWARTGPDWGRTGAGS